MVTDFDLTETTLSLAEMKQYILAAQIERWSQTRFDALAQFLLDVTETP